jgi:hypothetical protein
MTGIMDDSCDGSVDGSGKRFRILMHGESWGVHQTELPCQLFQGILDGQLHIYKTAGH